MTADRPGVPALGDALHAARCVLAERCATDASSPLYAALDALTTAVEAHLSGPAPERCTEPVVTAVGGGVLVHLPERVVDDVLTSLARVLYADHEDGPAATALLELGEADLVANAPAEIRDAWACGQRHDADVAADDALAQLRDAVGGVGLGLTTAECRELIGRLSAGIAQDQTRERAA